MNSLHRNEPRYAINVNWYNHIYVTSMEIVTIRYTLHQLILLQSDIRYIQAKYYNQIYVTIMQIVTDICYINENCYNQI